MSSPPQTPEEFASTFAPELIRNSNDGPPHLDWGWGETILSIPLTLIVLGTIIGNFLVLFSFATRTKTLRSPTHFFIANLALADFLVGILVMPYLATLQLTNIWYLGQTFCIFWTVTHFWLCSASILSTCAVCIERYVGVRYPLRHKEIMNSMTLGGIIACVWILAGFLSLLSIFAWPEPYDGNQYSCRLNHQLGHVIVSVVFILYIPAAVMITLYWRIYTIATKHLNQFKRKSTVTNFEYEKMKAKAKAGSLEGGRIQPKMVDQENSSGDSATSVSFSSTSSTGDAQGSSVVIIGSSSGGNSKQSIASSKGSSSKSEDDKVHTKKQINLAKRLSLLVGILLASYIPFFTLYLVMSFHPPNTINGHVFMFFGWIRYFNSCLNPFIYAFAVPAYRKALQDIICMGKCFKYN